jgi:hypothetical protein
MSVRLEPYVFSMQFTYAILSSLACPAVQYFSTLSHKWHDFRKKNGVQKVCFGFLYKLFPKHFSF